MTERTQDTGLQTNFEGICSYLNLSSFQQHDFYAIGVTIRKNKQLFFSSHKETKKKTKTDHLPLVFAPSWL